MTLKYENYKIFIFNLFYYVSVHFYMLHSIYRYYKYIIGMLKYIHSYHIKKIENLILTGLNPYQLRQLLPLLYMDDLDH